MTYQESIENCLNKAAEFGLDSPEYNEARAEMFTIGKKTMETLSKKQRVINFLYQIKWLLKRKKY